MSVWIIGVRMHRLVAFCIVVFYLIIRRPPISTLTDTLFPYTTLFRSRSADAGLPASWETVVEPLEDASETLWRSEEHTSELQSLMRNSYAVFCLKKKKPQSK